MIKHFRLPSNPKLSQGYTLIELMVVLVVLGIMAAFAITTYSRYRERANLDIAQTMLTIYAHELVVYQLKAGRAPNTSEEYAIFLKQFKHDPNLDPQYRDYFQIKLDAASKELKAVPQKKHRFKSYAKMALRDYSIQVCHKARALYVAQGGICKKTITATGVNQ
ncbi:MAG: prepilin-type N-terminal cleavage/methylation domain-containing protein [Neisseriaceae bacterium]